MSEKEKEGERIKELVINSNQLTEEQEEALSRLRFNCDFTSQDELQAKIKEISGDIDMLKIVDKQRASDE